jgi:N-methylhydantoinase B
MMRSDAVFLQVLNSRLLAITTEFAENILRAAHSTFIKETWDIAALIMSPQGEVISCPKEVAAKRLGMSLRKWLEAGPSPASGDIFISNDPIATGLASHLNDVFIWKPVYCGDRLVCYALAFVHVSDLGGLVPGSISPAASDIFQEGLRISPVRLFRQGELVEEVRELMLANSRVPAQLWGDIGAVVGALNVCERRLLELLASYDAEIFAQGTEKLLKLAEERSRSLIREIPDGEYSFTDYIDGLPGLEPIRIKLTLRIEGDNVTLDFTGSADEVRAAYNVYSHSQDGYWGLCRAFTDYFETIDPSIAWNNGLVRPIEVVAPEGSVLNPHPGASCGARVATYFRIYYMILGALNKAVPGTMPSSGPASTGVMLVATGGGGSSRRINVGQAIFGGGGARPTADGFDGNEMVSWYLRNIPIEILEHEVDVVFKEYAISPGTGGAGRYRGGHGTRVSVEFLIPATVTIRGLQRHQFRAWGVGGGRPGSLGSIIVNPNRPDERRIDAITVLEFDSGETLSLTSPGGGGFGDPLERIADEVAREVDEGLLSPEDARDHYGILIDNGEIRLTERRNVKSFLSGSEIDYGAERINYESRQNGRGVEIGTQ